MIFLSRCSVLDSYGSSDCSAVKSVPLRGSVWLQHGGAGSRGFAALREESLWLSDYPTTTVAALPPRHSLKAKTNTYGKREAFRTGCGQAAKSHTLPRRGTDSIAIKVVLTLLPSKWY